MKIQLELFSILREKLPREARGQTVLELSEGATVADIIAQLDITGNIVVSVNDVHDPERSQALKEGDNVKMFSSVGGG
jgi:sulfur carrier protein ThiS